MTIQDASIAERIIEEGAISLSAAARFIKRSGEDKAPHPSTVFRWGTTGVSGVRLETVYIGRRIVTSRPAVMRFIERVTEAKKAMGERKREQAAENAKYFREKIAKSRVSEQSRTLAHERAEKRLREEFGLDVGPKADR